jgi:hypothetical protein
MSRLAKTRLIIAYAFVAMITYGHAYNTRPDVQPMFTGQEIKQSTTEKAIDSIFIAALWPLYVSINMWEGKQ